MIAKRFIALQFAKFYVNGELNMVVLLKWIKCTLLRRSIDPVLP